MRRAFFIISFFIGGHLTIVSLIFVTIYIWETYQIKKQAFDIPILNQMQPSPTDMHMNEVDLKFHATIPYWEQDEAAKVFREQVSHFDYLSMFWYTLNSNRKIVPYRDAVEDESIIEFARQNNVKVLALITNLPDSEDSDWDSDRVRSIISTPQNREAHIREIMQLLNEKDFDGVNIDYEELDDDLSDEFSVFIKELSTELHLQGKIVSVAIHPKSGELISAEDNGSRAQDWEEIAQYADHMYFMTYGEHWNTSEPGPIASIPWDTKIIAYAQLLQLPLEKVFLGTPLYAVRWEEGSRRGEGLLYPDVQELQRRFNVQPEWNDRWKSPSLKYTENGKRYVVWFENARSVREKIDLAKRSGIGGISYWHIGHEDPEVWNLD